MSICLEDFKKKLETLHDEASRLIAKPQRDEQDKARITALKTEIMATKASYDAELASENEAKELGDLLIKPANQNINNNAGHPDAKPTKAAHSEQKIELIAAEDDKLARTGGFKSHGHFCWTLLQASNVKGNPSPQAVKAIVDWTALCERLSKAKSDEDRQEAVTAHKAWKATKAATGMGISADPSADIFVPMEFSNQVFARREKIDSDIASRCTQMQIRGNTLRIPAWNDSSRREAFRAGGAIAYWEDEGDLATPTKLGQTRYKEFRLKRLTAVVYATDELLDDSQGAVETYINMMVPRAISFKLNQAIFEGNGVGKPKGIMQSGAKIKVDKVASQTAATINATNISKMWQRFSAAYRTNALWHINQDCEAQLDGLYFATGANSGQLVYLPPGGLTGQTTATLKGRPVIPLEFCETLGTEGDIMLVDWSQMMVVTKGDTQRDVSMHVAFLTHEQTFRYSLRVDSDHMWDAPITPLKSNETNSCFVTLESRA